MPHLVHWKVHNALCSVIPAFLVMMAFIPQLLSCRSTASQGFRFEIDDGSGIVDPTVDFELSSTGPNGDTIALIIPANTLSTPHWVRLNAVPLESICVQGIKDKGFDIHGQPLLLEVLHILRVERMAEIRIYPNDELVRRLKEGGLHARVMWQSYPDYSPGRRDVFSPWRIEFIKRKRDSQSRLYYSITDLYMFPQRLYYVIVTEVPAD